jgi:formate dehydrogenase subunit gamma
MAEPTEPEHVTAQTARILAAFAEVEAPLLEILHAVQSEFGCVPEAAQRQIADHLNLSRAEVHGVTSFYHDFRAEPAGRHTLKICRAEACQSMGGEANAKRVAEALGIGFGETTADGATTLEAVYCLGLCACAPAAMLDGRPVGRVDAATLDTLIAGAQR